MQASDVNEIELFEKKRKRKLIIFPLIFIFVVIIVLLIATFFTKLAEDLNFETPIKMTITRFRDQRIVEVIDERKVKEVTRSFRRLDLEEVNYTDDIHNYIENAYEVVMLFEDEDGYEHEERYFFAGPYIHIQTENSAKFYKMDGKDSNTLRETVSSAIRRQRDNN